jgi:hypothetical protein
MRKSNLLSSWLTEGVSKSKVDKEKINEKSKEKRVHAPLSSSDMGKKVIEMALMRWGWISPRRACVAEL